MRNNEFYEIERGAEVTVGLSMSYNFMRNRFVGVMQFRYNNIESFNATVDNINFKVMFNEKMAGFIKYNQRLKDLKFYAEGLRVDYKNSVVSVSFEEEIN